jgi:hypothetical protein
MATAQACCDVPHTTLNGDSAAHVRMAFLARWTAAPRRVLMMIDDPESLRSCADLSYFHSIRWWLVSCLFSLFDLHAENLFDSICSCVRVANINNLDALLRFSTPSLPRSSFQAFIAPGPCSHSRHVFLELSLPQPKNSQLTLNTSRPLCIHLYLVMPFYIASSRK